MKRHLCLVISLFIAFPFIGGWSSYISKADFVFFEVNSSQAEVTLAWEISTSDQAIRAIIERQEGQKPFEIIGGINLRTQNGQTDFEFVDSNPIKGVPLTYKVRLDHEDGETIYSIVRETFLQKENPLHISPNPMKKEGQILDLQLDALTIGAVTLNLYSVSGQLLIQQEIDTPYRNHVTLPVSNLPTGTYFLQIQDQLQTWTQKFIKE